VRPPAHCGQDGSSEWVTREQKGVKILQVRTVKSTRVCQATRNTRTSYWEDGGEKKNAWPGKRNLHRNGGVEGIVAGRK